LASVVNNAIFEMSNCLDFNYAAEQSLSFSHCEFKQIYFYYTHAMVKS